MNLINFNVDHKNKSLTDDTIFVMEHYRKSNKVILILLMWEWAASMTNVCSCINIF